MSAVHWTDQQRIGFADPHQDGRITFSSMIRFVGAGQHWLWFSEHGTLLDRPAPGLEIEERKRATAGVA